MLVIYFLPIGTYLKFKYSSITNPEVAQLIKRGAFVQSPRATNRLSDLDLDDDDIDKGKSETIQIL